MAKENTIITLNGKRFRSRLAVFMLCYQVESPQIYALEELPDDIVEPVEDVEDQPPLSLTEIEEFNSQYRTHFWRIRKKGFGELFISKGWDPGVWGVEKCWGETASYVLPRQRRTNSSDLRDMSSAPLTY